MLVMVDSYSKCIEDFPTSNEEAKPVAKCLLQDIVTRFGVPQSLDSDKGTQLEDNERTTVYCDMMQVKRNVHVPFHPESSGLVKHYNGVLKNKMAIYEFKQDLPGWMCYPSPCFQCVSTQSGKLASCHTRY
jgi:hypothetical protein